jgi:hypothetical protein
MDAIDFVVARLQVPVRGAALCTLYVKSQRHAERTTKIARHASADARRFLFN